MHKVDLSRFVFVNQISADLKEAVIATLISYGFEKKRILFESAAKLAQVGDYAVNFMRDNNDLWLWVTLVTSAKTPGGIFGPVIDKIKIKNC